MNVVVVDLMCPSHKRFRPLGFDTVIWHDDGGGDGGTRAARATTWTGAFDSNGDFREREGVDVQG